MIIYVGREKTPFEVTPEVENTVAARTVTGEHGCTCWTGMNVNGVPYLYTRGMMIPAARLMICIKHGEDVLRGRRILARCAHNLTCVNPDHHKYRVQPVKHCDAPGQTAEAEGHLETPPMLDALAIAQGMDVPFERVPRRGEMRGAITGHTATKDGGARIDVKDIVSSAGPDREEHVATARIIFDNSAAQLMKFIKEHVTTMAVFPSGTHLLGGPRGRALGVSLEDAAARLYVEVLIA